MKLSVIVPAYNEAKWIQRCLSRVFAGLQANARPGLSSEIIVVDNNSTDGTGELARAAGTRVVFEPVNQIARARNAGAASASGDWLLFFDADTVLPAETLADVLSTMQRGRHLGGGTTVAFDEAPVWAKLPIAVGNLLMRTCKVTPGCLIFCRTDAFREIGGFNEKLFAAEDADFGYAMRRLARLRGLATVILRKHPPITSSRKLRLYTKFEILGLLFRFLHSPRTTLRNKKGLQIFYDGRR